MKKETILKGIFLVLTYINMVTTLIECGILAIIDKLVSGKGIMEGPLSKGWSEFKCDLLIKVIDLLDLMGG